MSDYAAGLGATALVILVAHWFPWPKELHRLIAYSIGVASMLFGMAIWLVPSPLPCVITGEGRVGVGITGTYLWLLIASFALVSGLATCLAWFIDYVLHLAAKERIHDATRRTDD